MLDLLGFAGFISLASVAGVVFVHTNLKVFLHNNGHFLISFSAGVFLLTASFIIFEVFEHLESLIFTVGIVAIGFIASKSLVMLFPETHHHHDECCHGHKKSTVKKIIIGDSLHNIADGIILASSYLISPNLLFPLFLAIVIHEILQEISEFFVLKDAGYSTKKAIFINFLTSLTIFIGIAISLFIGDSNIQYIILGVSSGFLLNIVYDDLLPHRHQTENLSKHFLALVFGSLIIAVILVVFSH